jgi:3-oxoacyl-[acyl-carrier-protein] synthase II
VAAAISRALADAKVDPAQVVHVNAHSTSTPEGDALEAQALVKALGSATDGVVVTSTKSMTGHLLGGAGTIRVRGRRPRAPQPPGPADHQCR